MTRKRLYGISKMQLNSFLFIIVPEPQHQNKRQIKFVYLRQSRILIFLSFFFLTSKQWDFIEFVAIDINIFRWIFHLEYNN